MSAARREDAESFVDGVRADDPELASYLRIEERELEAGRAETSRPEAAAVTLTTNYGGAQRVPRCPRRSASSRRRARFVGRVPRSAPSGRESRHSAACSSRAIRDSGVSAYIVSASLAGPRRSATPVTTSVRRTVLIVTSIASPVRMTFEGFTRSPFTCTRPPRTAPVAALRVLNMRAAQSHLSIRT